MGIGEQFELEDTGLIEKDIQTLIDLQSKKIRDGVTEQRAEILLAFVAKYGFEPERTVQTIQHMDDGSIRWVNTMVCTYDD